MFEQLTEGAKDPILSLSVAFREDPRPERIDLGIGVYRNSAGDTPIMAAVRVAQQELAHSQTTKSYVGLTGNEAFNSAMLDLLLGDSAARQRAVAIQTPGASGALRLLADLIRMARPGATVWMSDPSYVNHAPIMRAAGLKVAFYPYFDALSKGIRVDEMMAALAAAGRDDVVLLHGSCHNPTGADLPFEQWQTLAQMAARQGFMPFVDVAYQGFGESLDGDVAGLRLLADAVPELVIATSCSKNFGLYRERVGAAVVIANSPTQGAIARGRLQEIARTTYTMPPDFGAALVARVLTDPVLRQSWQAELVAMQQRIAGLRQQLAVELRQLSGGNSFDYVARHRGMFSMTALSAEAIVQLRDDWAIYVVPGGRINIAGLREEQIPRLAQALVAVSA